MLSFDVTVPEFGESATPEGGVIVLGDGKSVSVTFGDENGPIVAVMLPAERALDLSRELWSAARKADPENANLIASLRRSFAGNA